MIDQRLLRNNPALIEEGLKSRGMNIDLVPLQKHCKNLKDLEEKRADLVSSYEKEFANPYKAAELGYLDNIILPEETRGIVYKYLCSLKNKKHYFPNKKHGNIQL